MSTEQAQLYMIKGVIADATTEEQELIEEARVSITEVIDKYEERKSGVGLLAMGVVALEKAIAADKK